MERSGLRILQVEDAPTNLQVLDDMLRTLGHVPCSVASAAEALQALWLQPFDLIFTDLHMPHVSGRELLEILQRSGRTFPPVVLVTADAMSGSARDYLRMGFADFLTKPLRLADLRRVIGSVCEPFAGDPRLRFG
jgi:CheY-like chemotaxis protein